jgi:phosphate transport system permease protein
VTHAVADLVPPSVGPPIGTGSPDTPVVPERVRTLGDRVFRLVLIACSSTVLITIVAIVLFLLYRGSDAWRYQGHKLFTTDSWVPRASPPSFGFLGPLVGSFIIALIAIVVAVPIAVTTALAINEYVPRGLRRPLTALIDLLAALPSLVFGLWAIFFLDRHMYLTVKWLGRHATFIPLFHTSGRNYGNSLFESGIVVGIMILPIVTAISREVMSLVPRDECEAALALGGTRWGMITDVILPFARSGIIGGVMLGLGRALGETIAVRIILVSNDRIWLHILQPGGGSISALIVREFAGSSRLEQSALTVAGVTLFAITLGINIGARLVLVRTAKRLA